MSVTPLPPIAPSVVTLKPQQIQPDVLSLTQPALPSATQAMTLLAAGLAAGAALPIPSRSSSPQMAQGLKSDVSKILFLFNKPLYSLGTLFEKAPEFRAPLAIYALVAGLGVLGASALQGIQEAWVRLEESQIRAQLVARLTRVFAQSIRLKQQSDSRLMQETEHRLAAFIAQQGVRNPWQWIHCAQASHHGFSASSLPNAIPEASDALLPYQPMHRGQNKMQPAFGRHQPLEKEPSDLPQGSRLLNGKELGWMIGGVLFGAGFLAGIILKNVLAMPASSGNSTSKLAPKARKMQQLEESVTVNDLEAMVTEKAHLGDWRGMAGMLATGGLLGASKLTIDGLRQVAVTRANADTEYRYQCTNWLSLDPAFHAVAENTAVEEQLQQFSASFPMAKTYPLLVVNQMARILGGIGYHSAPKYFLMTPPVGLVDARG
ncbi:MAG: hypothetical protein VKK59_00245 [Vampirovibrionales bacterium]|nr:hypothetical protein [Vampirovibrionales bacterium]